MESIKARIKKDGLKPVYLVHGQNEYLREKYVAEIIGLLADDRETEIFEGEAPLDEVILSASMLSLFSGGKIILQRKPQWLKQGSEGEKLLSWLEEGGTDHVLIFTVPGKADGRSRLVKTLKKKQMVIECPEMKEWDLPGWIIRSFREKGKKIGKSEAQELQARVGNDQAILEGEIRKICLYAGSEERITSDMVRELASSSAMSSIFDLLDAFSAQDGTRAIRHFRSLVQMKEPEVKILFMLAKQVRILYQGKLLLQRGLDDGQIAKTMEVNPYVWKKARPHALRMDSGFLKQALYAAGELDFRIKTGQGQPGILLETFLLSFCTGSLGAESRNEFKKAR